MFWDDHYFDEIIDVVRGHTIGLLVNRFGNYGDQLIERATHELFARHGVRFHSILNLQNHFPRDVTMLADPGGGNVGSRYCGSPRRRRLVARLPIPKIVLPQTASDTHEDLSDFQTIFARDNTTYQMLKTVHKDVRLVPDMTLSLKLPPSHPNLEAGEFMRCDREATRPNGRDPVSLVDSLEDYLALAGQYRRVTTNRLHFGLAALLQGQACVLCANNYHKNRSFYETWLKDCPQSDWKD